MPTKKALITLGNYYLYLAIYGSFCFLMVRPLSTGHIGMNNSLVEMAKVAVQSIIVNPTIKQLFMFILLLYTTFVAIESLIFIRNCAGWLYYKSKGNNVTD